MVDTINYHFTNHCNYSCKNCFVDKKTKELSLANKLQIIDNVSHYFKSKNTKGRLNLVGGEPLLSPDIDTLIQYSFNKDLEVSIVTNGVLINQEFLEKNHSYLSMIGLSIDSLDKDTNISLGRCLSNKTSIEKNEWLEKIELIRKYHIKLKINVCLSRINLNDQSMFSFLKNIKPDRLKVLGLSISNGINDNSRQNVLTDDEIDQWCKNIADLNPIIEYGGQMHNAYAVINAMGQLIINDLGNEVIIKDLINNSIIERDMKLIDKEKYNKRYGG